MMGERSMFSKEERNFWILDVLIKHVAPPAVRKRFDIIVPPKDLANMLNNNAKILQKLFSKKVINIYQQRLLLRVPGVKLPTMSVSSGMKATSSEDFDVTLMICLLRNLNLVSEPATGWDRVPLDSDNSLGTNMTRIKEYRNKLAHPSKNRMGDNSFKKIWTSLKKSLSEISEGGTDKKVHEIETFDFGGSNREQLLCKIQQGLHEMQKELQFHRNLKENSTNVLQEWKFELEVFYRTRGTSEVLDKIRTNNTVTIIGNSGSGKSATMKYVAFLLKEEGYEITPVSSATDIPVHRFSDRKQIFVIDDIFGKYKVDTVMFESWRRLDYRLKVIFRDRNAKLLCTLRRQLQNDISQFIDETIFDTTVVDLDSYDLALSEIEKKGILENHLLHRKIEIQFDDVSINRICISNYAFPLMCKLFSSNSDFLNRKANFFTFPSVIRKEFDHLQKENKKVYCALVLIIIFDCEELKNIFDITCEINRRDDYNLVLQACGVGESIARTCLYDKLLSVSGVFVGSDNPFIFIHDNIEENVAYHFGSHSPKIMLQCCKRAFLRERIRITRHGMDDENVLVITPSSYDALSQRFLKEILNGKFHDILLSEPLQNKSFVNHFVSHIEKNKISLNHLESTNCTEMLLPSYLQVEKKFRDITNINREALTEVLQSSKRQFIYWVAATGNHLLFHHIFERPKGVVKRLHERYTNLINDLLHIAVLGGSIAIINSIIKNGANVNSCDKYGTPLLCKIAGTKRCDIAKLLIEGGADKNKKDEVLGWTACHVASWFNDIGMLKLLLSRGSDVNVVDSKFRVPLVVAVERNNEQAVSVLLSYGAYVPEKSRDMPLDPNVLLEKALHNKNSEMVELLFKSSRVQNYINICIPFLFKKNRVVNEMLKLFLESIERDNPRSRIGRDFVEVSFAIYKSNIGKIHEIFNNNKIKNMHSIIRGIHTSKQNRVLLANFNQNYLLFAPLHIAAVCDDFKAAKALMSYGANPFQRDVLGRTALHLANSKDMIEIFLCTSSTTFLTNLSSQSVLQKVLNYIFPFKFSKTLEIQNDVNVRDNVGNTPLHSILIRISNVKRSLDAVETLIECGANPCLRCSQGFLPIHRFRSVSQMLKECDIERGERILGCNKTKNYIEKQKWYFMSWAVLFAICYLWFCLFVAKRACNERGSGMSTDDSQESDLFQFRYMFYSQVFVLIILHRSFLPSRIMIQSMFAGIGSMPTRSDIYSDKHFFGFSEKIAIAMSVVRIFCYGITNVSGQTIFNLYCVYLCSFVIVIYCVFPNRRISNKYQYLLLAVSKVILVCFLMCMIVAFFLSPSIESKGMRNLDQQHWSYIGPFLFFLMKLLFSYFYTNLFIKRIILSLLKILFQPLCWYKNAFVFMLQMCCLSFFIIEILTVPVTMFVCNVDNC